MSWLFKKNTPYIKEHQHQLVKSHKYQGEELSYSYNYFYSPVCTWISKCLPLWLAPNLISLAGFLFNLIPHLMVPLLFTHELEYDLPSWFCYFMGIAFFLYMLCDNTDGKQARRTGSSSPLGMLIDHGMDSVTAVINTILIITLLQIGSNFSSAFGMIAATMPFYYAIIEQYYTGELILPEINGIDDGSFLYMGMCFAGGYYGPRNLYTSDLEILGYKTQVRYVLFYVLLSSSFVQIIPNLINIYKKRNSERFKQLFRKELFISHLLWYVINAVIFFTAVYTSPQNISVTHTKRVQYAFGFNFILIALRIQYSGVTLEKFNPFRRTTLITWALLLSQIFFTFAYGQSLMHEPTLYLILDLIAFAALLHIIYNLIMELTTILDINLLTLTQKQIELQATVTKRD